MDRESATSYQSHDTSESQGFDSIEWNRALSKSQKATPTFFLFTMVNPSELRAGSEILEKAPCYFAI